MKTLQKIYIVSGENSGDLHGSNLVKALQKKLPNAIFRGTGGDHLHKAGMDIFIPIQQMNFMGFVEVLMNIRTIWKILADVKSDISNWKPDVVILIDYPGFNLRLAPFIFNLKIPVIYYISPQLWAWKKSRIEIIRKYVKRLLVILPFEKEFYSKENISVDFVGHPLLDALSQESILPLPNTEKKPMLAVLPGSRKQEISIMLPEMLKAAKAFPHYKIVVAGVKSQPAKLYTDILSQSGISAELVWNQTYALLKSSHLALVTSGTATLETALFNVPQVVCYKGNELSYRIARQLVKVKYISLVNLILDKPAIQELIQQEMKAEIMIDFLHKIETGPEREKVLEFYQELHQHLGGIGASERAAENIISQCID